MNGEVVMMLNAGEGNPEHPFIFCPGCRCGHSYDPSRWQWNGDKIRPTFTPSMLVNRDDPKSRCHSYITNGMMQFLPDCFHELKNQTVALRPFTIEEGIV